MSGRIVAALVLAVAGLAPPQARAESDPLQDPGVLRIREAFKVDGIALFDPHAEHAPRMGICAQSIFAGLKWCVSGTAEEKSGEASYIKTTGYNINADNRIVYAISSRRSYPLKRAEFDGIIHAIGERYGAGAGVLAFRKTADDTGGVDSLIAVWGGLRLVQLTEAEYALVESGASLKRGHLVDHRFNLVVSAKQRDPIYKIEGEAGFILHLMSTSPDRADLIARAVYAPVFLPPPAKPGAEAGHPLVGETVRRPSAPPTAARPSGPVNSGAASDEQAKRIEAERGLAAERLLREEAERRAAEEKAARDAAERKAAAERRAFEEEKKRLDEALKAARERADRARPPTDETRRAEEAERKTAERREAEERARQLEEQRKALEERRRKDEAEKKAAEERAKRAEAERAEAERKALDERRRKEETERKAAEEKARAEAERKAAEEQRRKDEAERADRAQRDRLAAEEEARRRQAARPEPEKKVAAERAPEERIGADQKRAQEESERAAEQSRRRADEQGATERKAESERLARERAQRPDSWRQRAAAAAKDAGAIWSFGETQDRVADERTLRSQTVFGSPQQQGEKRLAIEVTFECTMSGRDRRLVAIARGFDRNSGVRVAFRSDGEGTFGVRTRFMLDDNVPQGGLLFRERQEDTASILELPMATGTLSNNAPRGAIWLRHYMVMVEFPLVTGTVTATIAPQADNLRRVLEACAQ